MTELDKGVIYLQNIQRNERKYNSMSCPRVHTARARYAPFLSRAAATREEETVSFKRPAGVATVDPSIVTIVTVTSDLRFTVVSWMLIALAIMMGLN